MKRSLPVLLLLFGVFGLTCDGWASREYVTDSFEITLRSGPSTGNKVISMLSSGKPVDVLRKEEGWALVKIPDGGKEGWVVSRYLISRLPWEIQAKSLQDEVAELKTNLARMSDENAASSKSRKSLADELKEKTRQLEQLQEEHAELKKGAEGYLKLKAQYAAAEKNLTTARNELRKVLRENEEIRASQITWWFTSGALVLLCGLFIGVLVGRQQKKRRALFE